eukprot:COSAG05_NODE_3400_length_2085_cov_3.351964_3_plen_142_part_00
MAEMMSWLSDPSEGNVAGSLGAELREKPWELVQTQWALKQTSLEAAARGARLERTSTGNHLREKDNIGDAETENPVAEREGWGGIPVDSVRMKVTSSRFSGTRTVVSSLDTYAPPLIYLLLPLYPCICKRISVSVCVNVCV